MKRQGEYIQYDAHGTLQIPDNPIIPYIEGDGIGVDISPVMQRVVDAAVGHAYPHRQIVWQEVYAGEKANALTGQWLPDETLAAITKAHVAIKGPLTTPVGMGMRSLNVAIRQRLDLYICQRPLRYFPGTPSPVCRPEAVDMVIFRENAEDIYAGIEWPANSPANAQVLEFLLKQMGITEIRFPECCGIGIKPISRPGSCRLIKAAIEYAIAHQKSSVTLVHKGNIMKYTEGAFKDWGYELARDVFGATPYQGGPWHVIEQPNQPPIIIKDMIADAFLQQILLRPEDYSVIATTNLNGDYISDALAAQIGGIGIAPGANLGEQTAVFEATHGTAPKYAGLNKVNPSSLILSAKMMLEYIGWLEAADNIQRGIEQAIRAKMVTYDFARLMTDSTELSCSEFGKAIIERM